MPAPKGALVFLHGELGAGKTTLVRGLLRAYGVEGAVRSPTYTLIEPYEIRIESTPRRIFHLDLYRLADPEELDYLGWQELLGDGGLLLIEWPERGAGVLPPPDFSLRIASRPPGRSVSFRGRGDWRQVAGEATRVLAPTNV
nr:tRNA (adenosine(37)-N6)-threonylcarbamoyltransferase complex ATPase subunit type 1 TsaE [Thiorhodovibrio winogradskyi]